MDVSHPTQPPDSGVTGTLEKTLRDTLELVRAEVALAKRELVDQVSSVASSAAYFVVAAMLVQAALTTLGVLLVLTVHSTALGLVVVAGFLVTAAGLGLLGVRVLKSFKLSSPERLKLDARKISEAVR